MAGMTFMMAGWLTVCHGLTNCAVISGASPVSRSIIRAEQAIFESTLIFDPEKENHGHVHASCIVECPNGDLRAVWYENGQELPPPYFLKERDKSDDVRIGGSRKPMQGGTAWDAPFVMADTFGVSDNNPCLVVDRDARLWLFHAVLLGVPEKAWASALIRYHIASSYDQAGPPKWDVENLLIVHPVGFENAFQESMQNARISVHNTGGGRGDRPRFGPRRDAAHGGTTPTTLRRVSAGDIGGRRLRQERGHRNRLGARQRMYRVCARFQAQGSATRPIRAIARRQRGRCGMATEDGYG